MYFFPSLRPLSAKTILLLSNSLGYIQCGKQEVQIKAGKTALPSRFYLQDEYNIPRSSIPIIKKELNTIGITLQKNLPKGVSGYELIYPELTIRTAPFINYLEIFSDTGILSHNETLYLSWMIYRDTNWYKIPRQKVARLLGICRTTQNQIENDFIKYNILHANKRDINWQELSWILEITLFIELFWQELLKHGVIQNPSDSDSLPTQIQSKNVQKPAHPQAGFWTIVGRFLNNSRQVFEHACTKDKYIKDKNYVLAFNNIHKKNKRTSPLPLRCLAHGKEAKPFPYRFSPENFPTSVPPPKPPPQFLAEKSEIGEIGWLSIFEHIINKGGFLKMTMPEIKNLVNEAHRGKIESGIKIKLTSDKVSKLWSTLLSQYKYGHARNVLLKKERGIINTMITVGIDLPAFLEYSISNWELLKKLNSNKNGVSRLATYPDLMECYYMKDQILNLMKEKKSSPQKIDHIYISNQSKEVEKKLSEAEMIDLDNQI